MASEASEGNGTNGAFGCCETLRDILEAEGFEPFLALDEDGGVYMTVGVIETEEDGAGLVDQLMHFCPFCGTKLPEPETA